MLNHARKLALLSLLLLIVPAAIAACGGDDDDDDGEPTSAATSAATSGATPGGGGGAEIDISGIPELEDGTLNIGSDIAYAPVEFIDEETGDPAGIDIDLANALAEVLGVEAEFTNGAFDGLIPALQAERHDILMTAMSVNPERSEQVNFVEYFIAGSSIIVPSGNPNGIESIEDLCGLRVAVQEGTVQVEYLLGTEDDPGGQDQACKDAGEDGITVLRFGTDPEAVLALRSGQADAEMADFPVAAYSVAQSEGELELIENQLEPGPYGIALRKGSTALRDALQQALDAIMADGTYDEILEKWGAEDGAI